MKREGEKIRDQGRKRGDGEKSIAKQKEESGLYM